MSSCIDDLTEFYASLRLLGLLNPAKTEWIWFGSRVNLARIPERFRSLQVVGLTLSAPMLSVRDLVQAPLVVYLDSELSMKNYVNNIASACFYHIRRQFGLPASTLMPLQRTQNAAAHRHTTVRKELKN